MINYVCFIKTRSELLQGAAKSDDAILYKILLEKVPNKTTITNIYHARLNILLSRPNCSS